MGLFSGGGRGVDCATDRRNDPAALFEQQVKGRAVPQCIVCLVVFGGALAEADWEGSERLGEGKETARSLWRSRTTSLMVLIDIMTETLRLYLNPDSKRSCHLV